MFIKHLRADMKQLVREPILLFFALLPILLIAVFKLIMVYGGPELMLRTGFNLIRYYIYLVTLSYLLIPVMAGTVMGFFMLEERDSGVMNLLRVTPMGFAGYLVNRFFLPVMLTAIYGIAVWVFMGNGYHGIGILALLLVYLSVETVMIGVFVAMISEDKVRGLTNAKAVSAVTLFGLADLMPIIWVRYLALATPQYQLFYLMDRGDPEAVIFGLAIHGVWLSLIMNKAMERLA